MPEARCFQCFLRTAIIFHGVGRRLVRRAQSVLAAAINKLRPPQEVNVVRVIYSRIETQRATMPDVSAVGLDGAPVWDRRAAFTPLHRPLSV